MVTSFVVEDGTGLSTATSFVALQEAIDYFDSRLGGDLYLAASDVDKMRALNSASAMISTLCFFGRLKEVDQALAFPRLVSSDILRQDAYPRAVETLFDRDRFDQLYVDNVPVLIKNATILCAGMYLNKARDVERPYGAQSERVGEVEVTYRNFDDIPQVPTEIHILLKPVLLSFFNEFRCNPGY